MINRESLSAPHWMTTRRIALGLAVATGALTACGSSDIEVDANDYLPRDSAAAIEQVADPEVDARIGGMAEDAANSALGIVQAKNIEPRTALPNGLYYVSPPNGEKFTVHVELAGDPTDLSADNLNEVEVTRRFTDEHGGTSESFELARSPLTGEWSADIKHGTESKYLSPEDPVMDVDGKEYDIQSAQADINEMLGRLDAAA